MSTLRLSMLNKRCLIRCLAVCLAIFSIQCSTGAAADLDAAGLGNVRAKMQPFVDDQIVSGMVTLVGNSKGVVSHEALGSANLAENTAMPKDGLFRIASMTKPIIAVGIMILVDEGKLSPQDNVEKYLPEFKGQMLVEKREEDRVILKKPHRPITLHDLLTHTSGLPAYPAGIGDLYSKRHLTLAESTLVIAQQPLMFEPGEKWAYCNPGIDTLGRIIEVVSGQSCEKFFAERIFEPLGMKDTSFFPSEEQLKRLVQLYDRKENKLKPAGFTLLGPTEKAKHPIPAGGLYSTAADLARLYQMMLNRGTLDGKKIVSEAAVETMTKLQTGDLKCGFVPGMGFGYGWAVVKEPQGVTSMLSTGSYGHGGAFGTQGWIDPTQDFFVVLLIGRVGLANGDGSEMRRALQATVVEALKK